MALHHKFVQRCAKIGFDARAYVAKPATYLNHSTQQPAWVYLARCDRFLKVGVAADLQKRLDALQTNNPVEIEMVLGFQLPTRTAALRAERAIHEILAEHRVRNEWFDCPYEQMREAMHCVSVASREMVILQDAEYDTIVRMDREERMKSRELALTASGEAMER